MNTKDSYYVLIALIAGLAGILFGYDTGVMSGAILFIAKEFELSALTNGIVVSAVLLGAFFGAIFSGFATDRFGRKRVLVAVSLIFVVGTLITALVSSMLLFIFGRLVVGVAIGVASYCAPLYISEISPPRYRGALVSFNQLAISIGIFLSYVVDFYFARSENWRAMLGVGVIPALFLFIGMIILPHSPRWLVAVGNTDKAFSILHRIRGTQKEAYAELEEIIEASSAEKGTVRELFSPQLRPVVWIGALLAIIQQVTGINTILYYAPTIFTLAGFESDTASILATMGIGAIFVLFTAIALPLIDRWGRRPLLILGLFGMLAGLILLSLSFTVFKDQHQGHLVSILSMLLYIASFAISLGPVMWLMIAEIYPLKVRGIGASFATCVNWASNYLVTITFLTIVAAIGASGTFLVYGAFCVLSLLFVYFFVPETRGVTLEQIEGNLFAGKPWRELGE